MNGKGDKLKGVAKLRSRAEEVVQAQGTSLPEDLATLSPSEALKLIHELRVHQIELEMQNDQLCRAQTELNAARERYFDLYNLAPVGYFIVSREGRILETNLAGVMLLGVPRAALVTQPITRFIFKEDQDMYYLHRRKLLATGKALTCELRMVRTDGTPFWVRLTATAQDPSTSAGRGASDAPVSRVVLSDISEQKEMEHDKDKLDAQLQQAMKRSHLGPKPGKTQSGKQDGKKAGKKARKKGAGK